jgi:hypothetical protein
MGISQKSIFCSPLLEEQWLQLIEYILATPLRLDLRSWRGRQLAVFVLYGPALGPLRLFPYQQLQIGFSEEGRANTGAVTRASML